MEEIPPERLDRLDELRRGLRHGDQATQEEIEALHEEWEKDREVLRPREGDERFDLVDRTGKPTGVTAPRWLCHLLGLRHRCAHVLIIWRSPNLGDVFLLQVRHWERPDSPGHLDISVGGHVKSPATPQATAYVEMREELNISTYLVHFGGYVIDNDDVRPEKHFFNAEWRDVYVGEISTTGLEGVRFSDEEVVGLYLCPRAQAPQLLQQEHVPIASALEYSLPFILRTLGD